jgi:hypothetical protein
MVHGDSGDPRVSKELKALKKLKAPWYLEAEIQKRLRFREHHRSAGKFLTKPLPAYALSAVAVIALLIAGYSTLFRVGQVQDKMHPVPENAKGSVEQSQVPVPPSSPRPSGLAREPLPIPEKEQRGPSPPGSDATVPSKVMDRRPAAKGARIQDSTRTDSTKMIDARKDSLYPAQNESDTTVPK